MQEDVLFFSSIFQSVVIFQVSIINYQFATDEFNGAGLRLSPVLYLNQIQWD